MMKLEWKKIKLKGFTLIELIVVIAILGILLAIAVPRISGFVEIAKQASDEEAVALIANTCVLHYSKDPTITYIDQSDLVSSGMVTTDAFTLKSKKYDGCSWNISVSSGIITVTLVEGSNILISVTK